jgi:uncharacterized protein
MSRLPDFVDSRRAAEQGRCLEGTLPLNAMPRVQGMLALPEGEALFRLEFFLDAKHRACVRGQVQASVPLTCQRCLKPVAVEVGSKILLAVVAGRDEAERLPDAYDPLLTEDGRISPADLVEDEIILALPYVPKHGPGHACAEAQPGNAPATADDTRKDNPFQVLAQLKQPLH